MYCPNDRCPDFVAFGVRGEYRDEHAICPRCHAKLLTGSPPTPVEPDVEVTEGEPLVSVGSFEYEHEANLAASFLVSHGIAAVVAADDCGRTDPVLGVVTGGLYLRVPQSREEEAVELLASAETASGSRGV